MVAVVNDDSCVEFPDVTSHGSSISELEHSHAFNRNTLCYLNELSLSVSFLPQSFVFFCFLPNVMLV
jgi:hypothetical protein